MLTDGEAGKMSSAARHRTLCDTYTLSSYFPVSSDFDGYGSEPYRGSGGLPQEGLATVK